MLIAFSGAQSSGQSTLLQACKKLDECKDYTFVDEVTRRIKRNNNTEINNTASDYNYTQTLIIADHTKNATMSNTILDRCFLDGYVYTQYLKEQGKVSKTVQAFACKMYENYIGYYDIIFYTDSNIPLVDDGVRSVDKKFRDRIIELFEGEISYRLRSMNINVVKLSGSVNDRITTLKFYLHQKYLHNQKK